VYLLAVSWADTITSRGLGFFIEHGHRQMGWLVGAMTLVLAVWMFLAFAGSRTRWLGLIALAAVAVQGILGGVRVLWHVRWGYELAALHGVLGQLTFAYLVCVAVFASRSWLAAQAVELDAAARLRRLATTTVGLVVGQLIVGVWLRQFGGRLGTPMLLHLLFALGIVAHALLLLRRVGSEPAQAAGLRLPVMIFTGLVCLQVALGAAAWLCGAGMGALDAPLFPLHTGGYFLVTLHVALGAAALASAAVVALRAWRHLRVVPSPVPSTLQAAGGAA